MTTSAPMTAEGFKAHGMMALPLHIAALHAQAAALPAQLGPFDAAPIVFHHGVPVGGRAQLTLFQNGGYQFNGHFHDSGAPSYNTGFVYAVKSHSGTLFVFSHKGHVSGTFGSGSRNDDWSQAGHNDNLASAWADLAAGPAAHWSAHAGLDFSISQIVNDIKSAAGAVSSVVSVVGAL